MHETLLSEKGSHEAGIQMPKGQLAQVSQGSAFASNGSKGPEVPTTARISRILLVDDSKGIHLWFNEFFKYHNLQIARRAATQDATNTCPEHFKVDSAYDGCEGMEKVRASIQAGEPYSMAFVDVVMEQGWDGIQTTAEIWRHDPELQVVLCTGCSDEAIGELIRNLGQADRLIILKKPFDGLELLQLAHVLTRKWRLFQESQLRVSGLQSAVLRKTEELQKSEERFRLIAENAADLVMVLTPEGKEIYLSPGCRAVPRGAKGQDTTGNVFDLVHPEDSQRVRQAIGAVSWKSSHETLECRLYEGESKWKAFELRISEIQAADELGRNILIVARDITDRKKAERERAMMELQLRQAHRLETIGQLAAGIAHEINTPTQYIGDNTRFLKDSFSELQRLFRAYEGLLSAAQAQPELSEMAGTVKRLKEDADMTYLEEEIPKAIQQSLEGVERVSRIVRSMKEFSHPGAVEKANVNLRKAVESTLTVCRNEWKYVADVETEFDPELPLVAALAGELNQVILNLIVNAAHAIGEKVGDGGKGKGLIRITTRKVESWAEIRISDTGTGIPEHVQSRMFDPFFTTKPVGRGTGQGLAIAHNVVTEKHRGILNFETKLGEGSTFIILLPLEKTTES